jgi:hypothetical protein
MIAYGSIFMLIAVEDDIHLDSVLRLYSQQDGSKRHPRHCPNLRGPPEGRRTYSRRRLILLRSLYWPLVFVLAGEQLVPPARGHYYGSATRDHRN